MMKREVTPREDGEEVGSDDGGQQTPQEFVSEFGDLRALQDSLERVQSDLAGPEENERAMQSALKEVVMDCLGVAQDLANGDRMDMKGGTTRSEPGTRRYSLRPRMAATYREEQQGTKDAMQKKTQTSTKRKTSKERATPYERTKLRGRINQTSATPYGLGKMECHEQGEPSASEEAGSDVSGGTEEEEDEYQHRTPEGRLNGSPSASLRQIVASLKEWRETFPAPSLCDRVTLPSLPEDFIPETILPRAMDVQMGTRQQDGPDVMRMDAPSAAAAATKVYVMPSGYIVQSVQLVLERKEAEKTKCTTSFLSPMFHPESYVHPFSENYIPLRRSLSASPPSLFLEMDGRLNMILTSPRTELLHISHSGKNMDVTSFLSRLDEQWERCCPVFQLPAQQSDAELEKNVKELLTQLHDVQSASEWGWNTDQEKPVSDTCDSLIGVEKRLNDFSQRMEKFYEVLS